MRLLLGVSVGDGGVVVAGNDAHADSGIAAESVWDGVGSAVWVVNATFWGIWIHSTHVTIRILCIIRINNHEKEAANFQKKKRW